MSITRRGFVQRAGLAMAGGALGACRPCPTDVAGSLLAPVSGVPSVADHVFENWSHTLTFRPRRFCRPRTEAEVVAIVKDALQGGTRVRTQGAGHSFSQLLATPDTLVTLDDLQRPLTVNGQRVTLSGGMRVKQVIRELRQRGLGFRNLGSITEQSIAGVISTGTHGSGVGLGALSTQIVGVRLVDGSGDVRTIGEADAEALAAARINLGALGIITEVTLDCVPDYQLEYTAYLTTFDEVIGQVDTLLHENDRVVLWWLVPPDCPRDNVVLITKNALGRSGNRSLVSGAEADRSVKRGRLARDPGDLRKLAAKGPGPPSRYQKILQYVGPYDEALTIPLLPVFHRECEYAIPVARTVEALKEMRRILEEGDVSLLLPIEVRFVAQDDILLSPCGDGAVAYVGASTLVNSTEVFERFEPLMKRLGGRPHWGKNATLTQEEVARMYPSSYDRFRRVRDTFDPRRVFANTLLETLFP
jgi:L-gulono-1,4-lactone dehydrogenase